MFAPYITDSFPISTPPRFGAGACGWPSERRLRLAACGCCRRSWHQLAPWCRRAVEAAEQYADAHADVSALEDAWRWCRGVEGRATAGADVAEVGGYLLTEVIHRVAAPVFTPADLLALAKDLRPWRGDSADNHPVDAACEEVFEDVFGAPVGLPPMEPGWRTTDAHLLALTAYERRDFDLLPVLADALADAGCDRHDVLDHCRSDGIHVRGCWVLDWVLAADRSADPTLSPPSRVGPYPGCRRGESARSRRRRGPA